MLNFCYLKIIHILNPRYHPNKVCVYIHKIVKLIITKIKMETKNGSHRYNISRPRSIHGHKYS